jgi:hypothetical protein
MPSGTEDINDTLRRLISMVGEINAMLDEEEATTAPQPKPDLKLVTAEREADDG